MNYDGIEPNVEEKDDLTVMTVSVVIVQARYDLAAMNVSVVIVQGRYDLTVTTVYICCYCTRQV